MRQLMALKDLLVDAVERTTGVVERSHAASARAIFDSLAMVPQLGKPVRLAESIQQLHAASIFGSVKLINRGVSTLIDGGHHIAQQALQLRGQASYPNDLSEDGAAADTPMRADAIGSQAWLRDSAIALLNGAFGDHLAEHNNALQTVMTLRHEGKALVLERDDLARQLPDATRRVCIFIHGLACTEWSWCYGADVAQGDPAVHYGTLLQRDLGFTPLFVRYNTGLHISENGRMLASLLDQLLAAYPQPIEEIVLLGHSMGGLVARSASFYGSPGGWVDRLSRVICLGSPHLGAPLEKASNLISVVLRAFNTMGTQIPGHLLNARSAGIKDLRFGYVVDEDWQHGQKDAIRDVHRTDIPFVEHASYYFVAATLTADPEHPVGQLLGDVLVRLPSAAGLHQEKLRCIPFKQEHGVVAPGLSHLQLSNHPAIYESIHRWCDAS